jgi:hypothetical protein
MTALHTSPEAAKLLFLEIVILGRFEKRFFRWRPAQRRL